VWSRARPLLAAAATAVVASHSGGPRAGAMRRSADDHVVDLAFPAQPLHKESLIVADEFNLSTAIGHKPEEIKNASACRWIMRELA
jgi:hypothetical protein